MQDKQQTLTIALVLVIGLLGGYMIAAHTHEKDHRWHDKDHEKVEQIMDNEDGKTGGAVEVDVRSQ